MFCSPCTEDAAQATEDTVKAPTCNTCLSNTGYSHSPDCSSKQCIDCYIQFFNTRRERFNNMCPLRCCHLPLILPANIRSVSRIPSLSTDHEGNQFRCPYCNIPVKDMKRMQIHVRLKCVKRCKIYDANAHNHSSIQKLKKRKYCLDCGGYFLENHKNECPALMFCPDCGKIPQKYRVREMIIYTKNIVDFLITKSTIVVQFVRYVK